MLFASLLSASDRQTAMDALGIEDWPASLRTNLGSPVPILRNVFPVDFRDRGSSVKATRRRGWVAH
jgi:hypothetical protein